ncbi:unnamed protein product [Closterium sp. NIES-64]|nr:unnamed protein product [Closterium sp. NIES-64]CAI5971643.1 unnamed protein product [Closterium sp. NIES-64]
MTRPPHVHWAVGGAQASARLLPPCPFSGGAPLANGTRCCPSSLPAWSAPARASRCRAPLTASSAAPAATAPPGLSSLGAHMSLERAAHPPTDSCVPAAAPAAARRRHSNLPALPIGHAPWNPLHRVLGALLFPTAGLAAVLSLRLARANVLVRLCVFGVFRVIAVLVEFRGPVFVVISLLGAFVLQPLALLVRFCV